jgi:hypothetical protein
MLKQAKMLFQFERSAAVLAALLGGSQRYTRN